MAVPAMTQVRSSPPDFGFSNSPAIRNPKSAIDSPAHGAAVLARVAPAHENAGFGIYQDSLKAAVSVRHSHHRVTAQIQNPAHLRADTGFQAQPPCRVAEARRFARLLDRHSEFHEVQENLHVPLRLVVSTHDAEGK